jgi:uncharacterized protein (DUF4213/DUF364 family)
MSYSLNLVTTVGETDVLLDDAQHEKRTFDVRKQNLALRSDNSIENPAELTAELNESQLSLDAVNAVIASLPDGEKKETEITKKLELELKIRKLKASANKVSIVNKIKDEYELAQLESQIATVGAFIAAFTARKAALN